MLPINGHNNRFRGWHSRGYLPHFDQPSAVQMVTFRLADSLPGHLLRQLDAELARTEVTERRKRIEGYLDNGHGACALRDPALALMVQEALLFFDTERYRLLAWVIMPNHVHLVLELCSDFTLTGIMHSLKSYTARQANRRLQRTGGFWQPDYFDRLIRDEAHLAQAIEYTHHNPVSARLCGQPAEWPWSSARPERGHIARIRHLF